MFGCVAENMKHTHTKYKILRKLGRLYERQQDDINNNKKRISSANSPLKGNIYSVASSEAIRIIRHIENASTKRVLQCQYVYKLFGARFTIKRIDCTYDCD